MRENIIQQKSFDFSIAVVETYKTLIYQRREYILSKQFLRSGTSIGANISEAIFGQSKKDFIHKLSISRKEANETLYWINLMERTGFLDHENSARLKLECTEILKILTSILKSSERR